MNGEKLELVESFGELRAGMIVVVKPPQCCGAAHHRHILTRSVTCKYARAMNDLVVGQAFEVEPQRACYPHLEAVVSESTVRDGRVFRVVDGLDPAADAETERRDYAEICRVRGGKPARVR